MKPSSCERSTETVLEKLEVRVTGTDRLNAEKQARYLGEKFYGVPGSQLECLMVHAEAEYLYDQLIEEAEPRVTHIFVCDFRLRRTD